jgi:hypothetical protein
MRIRRLAVVFAASALIVSLPLRAAPPDLIVAGAEYCVNPLNFPLPPNPGYALEWRNLWTDSSSQPDEGIAVVAAGGGGRVLALEVPPPSSLTRFNLLEVRSDQTRQLLYSNDALFPAGVVVGASGNIYVLAWDPGSVSILVLNAQGSLQATYHVPGPGSHLQHIDLAADQCTLYYRADDGALHRFNVCTGTPLTNFPAASPATAAVLPDGDILVGRDHELLRYDVNGSLVRMYSLGLPPGSPDVDAIALAAAGSRAIVKLACSGIVLDVQLDSGVATQRAESVQTVQGRETTMVAIDGWTAALGNAAAIGTTDIPLLSTWMLLAVTAIVALLALRDLG